MKVGPKSSLRLFLHRTLQLLNINPYLYSIYMYLYHSIFYILYIQDDHLH